jgi:flagellar biosynthesis/type III secretory pathway chaperone
METGWDNDLAAFLTDLLSVQEDTLSALVKKRDLLAKADTEGLAALGKEEEGLIRRLHDCLQRRETLLERAAGDGLPAESIQALTKALPRKQRGELPKRVKRATSQAKLLQHQSMINCLIAQRTLIHLSQMLEIIATGGQQKPTYGNEDSSAPSGALVDRAA